jgi:homoserine kinase
MDDEAVFTLAARLEGHPDNVAPAFFGGFTIALSEGDRFQATAVAVDPRVRVVAFVPPESLATSVARGLLPETVPHDAAAANAARAALLVVALSGRPELLLPATEDFLHQCYREHAMPESLRLMHDLRADGVAAVVSGAGPTVLAFVDASTRSAVRRRVPTGWDAVDLAVDPTGAKVTGGS